MLIMLLILVVVDTLVMMGDAVTDHGHCWLALLFMLVVVFI